MSVKPQILRTELFSPSSLIPSSWSLFLLPLPGPSPYPLDRFRFPVLLPGYVSRFCLARSSFNPDYCSLSASLHISLSAPSPFLSSHSVSISAPSTVPIPVSDTVFFGTKCVSRTEKPSLPAKFRSDTGFSAQKNVSRAAALSFRIERVCRVRRRWTSRDRLVSKHHLAVFCRKV